MYEMEVFFKQFQMRLLFFPLCLIQHTGSVYVEVPPAADFSQPAGPNLRCRPRLIQVLASRVLKKIRFIIYNYTLSFFFRNPTHKNFFVFN